MTETTIWTAVLLAELVLLILYAWLHFTQKRSAAICFWIAAAATLTLGMLLDKYEGIKSAGIDFFCSSLGIALLILFQLMVRISVLGNIMLFSCSLLVMAVLVMPAMVPPMLFILALSYFIMPFHRRLNDLTSPRYLPRIQRTRNIKTSPRTGFTLIELLIVVLMMAIFAAGVNYAVQAATRSQRFISNRLTAIEQAETQLARLSARDALPEPGAYPLDKDLLDNDTITSGQFIIEELDTPELRLVKVNIPIPEKPGYHVTLEKVLSGKKE